MRTTARRVLDALQLAGIANAATLGLVGQGLVVGAEGRDVALLAELLGVDVVTAEDVARVLGLDVGEDDVAEVDVENTGEVVVTVAGGDPLAEAETVAEGLTVAIARLRPAVGLDVASDPNTGNAWAVAERTDGGTVWCGPAVDRPGFVVWTEPAEGGCNDDERFAPNAAGAVALVVALVDRA